MRAVVIRDTSNRDSGVEDVPDPQPADDEVLVDVRACTVNFTDLLSLDGKYQNNPPAPFTPGKDAAGVVSAVGAGAAGHEVGDRVLAHVIHGAMAEKTVCPAALACPIPDGVGFETAAAMGLAHLTAHIALVRRGELREGEVVLVNGASGGVGLASLGVARALGAGKVLAGLTTPSKSDAALAAGADAVIDLSGDDLRDGLRAQVLEAAGGRGVDLAFDLVGGDVFDATLRAIADEGRTVVSGFTSGRIPSVRTNYLLLKNIAVVGSTVNAYMKARSPLVRETQDALFALLEEGRIAPAISHRFPLERYLDGIRILEDRKAAGKVVLKMS